VAKSKIFPSRPEKKRNELSFFTLEGKIEQQIQIRLENNLTVRSFETALSSLDFVYRMLRQTPQTPQKMMKWAKWTTESRQGDCIFFILLQK